MQNEVEFSFRENIEPVYRQYVNLLLQDGEGQALSQSRLKQAIKIFDDFQVAELEDFLNCNLELRSIIQPDSDSAFVYPIILGDRIQVIIQPPGQQPLVQYSVNVSEAQINETLRKLRREQEQTYVSDEGLRLSQQVYDWILRPAETHLKKRHVKTLVDSCGLTQWLRGSGLSGMQEWMPRGSCFYKKMEKRPVHREVLMVNMASNRFPTTITNTTLWSASWAIRAWKESYWGYVSTNIAQVELVLVADPEHKPKSVGGPMLRAYRERPTTSNALRLGV